MSAPNARTSPATPRNDAAERYSPPIADALSRGPTLREATKKSLVVRDTRSPKMPRTSVATETSAIAVTPQAALIASPLHDVGEVALGALGGTHVEPAETEHHRVDGESEQHPRQRHPQELDVRERRHPREEQRQPADEDAEGDQHGDRQSSLAAQQRAHVELA